MRQPNTTVTFQN